MASAGDVPRPLCAPADEASTDNQCRAACCAATAGRWYAIPRMRMRRVVAGACALAVAVSAPALAKPASIPAGVRAELLAHARAAADQAGDSRPYDIYAVATTRIKALRLSPGTAPDCEATPACADGSVYVVAMRGRFLYDGPRPKGAVVRATPVLMIEVEAGQPLPRWSSESYGQRYPKLRKAGTPVRLDSPVAKQHH